MWWYPTRRVDLGVITLQEDSQVLEEVVVQG